MAEVRDETAAPTISPEELALLDRVRAGDEAAFTELVERHHGSLLRVARMYVRSRPAAEDVVQDAWLAFLQGLDRFEGRSSLRTWLTAIVVNKAKTRGVREARSVPFSALVADEEEPAVEPERFRGADDPFPGHWRQYPQAFPEERLLAKETMSVVEEAILALPDVQRAVITLRDVEGWSSDEVCDELGLTEGNQRVLLHRARSRVRRALEQHFA